MRSVVFWRNSESEIFWWIFLRLCVLLLCSLDFVKVSRESAWSTLGIDAFILDPNI